VEEELKIANQHHASQLIAVQTQNIAQNNLIL